MLYIIICILRDVYTYTTLHGLGTGLRADVLTEQTIFASPPSPIIDKTYDILKHVRYQCLYLLLLRLFTRDTNVKMHKQKYNTNTRVNNYDKLLLISDNIILQLEGS